MSDERRDTPSADRRHTLTPGRAFTIEERKRDDKQVWLTCSCGARWVWFRYRWPQEFKRNVCPDRLAHRQEHGRLRRESRRS
jgi:hypothetical protein